MCNSKRHHRSEQAYLKSLLELVDPAFINNQCLVAPGVERVIPRPYIYSVLFLGTTDGQDLFAIAVYLKYTI